MVIGFDGSRAFPENRTGTENYSYQLLRALSKIDKTNKYIIYLRLHSVILNVSEGSKDLKARDSSQARNDNYGFPENFTFKYISWPRLWTQGGLSLATFKDSLDVLFVPSHTLPVIRKPKLKTVITVHDLGSEYLPSMHQVKQRLYLSYMQKYQLKTATKLIAVSNATKQDLIKRLGINKDKIEVVYEGYNENISRIDTKINSLKQFDLEKGKYFLFVGTVQPRKNLERIIKAFAIYLGVLPARDPAVHPHSTSLVAATRQEPFSPSPLENKAEKLIIIGSKGWLSDEIYKLPKKLRIEDKVKFLGYVSDEELPNLYSNAKAFLFPSLFEGFGLPILEAQACGCPVITSNISSMPEVAGKGAILIDPYNTEDIAKALERVNREDETTKLIKNGYENLKRFSWGSCARETLKILENI